MPRAAADPKPISTRQKQILNYIQHHMDAHGYPPTVREIGSNVGLSSSSTVHAHLKSLQEQGHIERDAVLTRAIKLTGTGGDEGRPPMKSFIRWRLCGRPPPADRRQRRNGGRDD